MRGTGTELKWNFLVWEKKNTRDSTYLNPHLSGTTLLEAVIRCRVKKKGGINLICTVRENVLDSMSFGDICRRSTSIGRLEEALEDEHEQYVSLRKNTSELDKQIDVHKPLVNLLDNLVTMGSLYSGDDRMLSSQYKKVR